MNYHHRETLVIGSILKQHLISRLEPFPRKVFETVYSTGSPSVRFSRAQIATPYGIRPRDVRSVFWANIVQNKVTDMMGFDGMYGACCIVFATVQSRSIWRWKQTKPK
jgi:hypothetical protein